MATLCLCLAASACSIRETAVGLVGDALSEGGGAYSADDDPELVREALPFGLKTYEGLLEVLPEHRGLLLSSARGFTAYAYLLQDEADRTDALDLAGARALRNRAQKLYLRGRDYALRGLEVSHEGFTARIRDDAGAALSSTSQEDVPYLYWAGVSWSGALSAGKGDLSLLAEVPLAAALVGRCLELDPTFELGAAHEYFVQYEGSRPGGSGEEARWHYRRALELSGGNRASVHLALAESVVVQEQNAPEFMDLLDQAMDVDPDVESELRLVNTIAQRRAAWLRSRIPDLFLSVTQEEQIR